MLYYKAFLLVPPIYLLLSLFFIGDVTPECCPVREDKCLDGKPVVGHFCGVGPCNIFGCNCDGGCKGRHRLIDPEELFKLVATGVPSGLNGCCFHYKGWCLDRTSVNGHYCGVGPCNMFGCNCEGGCRRYKWVNITKTTPKNKKN